MCFVYTVVVSPDVGTQPAYSILAPFMNLTIGASFSMQLFQLLNCPSLPHLGLGVIDWSIHYLYFHFSQRFNLFLCPAVVAKAQLV